MFETAHKLRQHLLTGVSFAIPFISCGGILIAISVRMVILLAMRESGENGMHMKVFSRLEMISHVRRELDVSL